mmetsp:Transcript_46392/g.123246  ORF Transcript_46392/g.123246 Transcript_46392/m.123246 type:complete len:207 (+) Transcript_46392:305-925(+)
MVARYLFMTSTALTPTCILWPLFPPDSCQHNSSTLKKFTTFLSLGQVLLVSWQLCTGGVEEDLWRSLEVRSLVVLSWCQKSLRIFQPQTGEVVQSSWVEWYNRRRLSEQGSILLLLLTCRLRQKSGSLLRWTMGLFCKVVASSLRLVPRKGGSIWKEKSVCVVCHCTLAHIAMHICMTDKMCVSLVAAKELWRPQCICLALRDQSL